VWFTVCVLLRLKIGVFTFAYLLHVTCLVFCCSQQCSSFVQVQMLLCQSASKFLYFIFLGGAPWRTTLTRRWRLRELRLTRRRRWQVCSFTSLLLLFFLRFSFSRFLWRCLTLLVLCLGLLRFVRLVEAVVKKVLPTKDKVLGLYVLSPKVENRQRRSSPFSKKLCMCCSNWAHIVWALPLLSCSTVAVK
jgi:hypothetical protein